MTIEKTKNGTDLFVTVEGRLDTLTSPQFSNEMRTALDGISNVTLDFAKLEYISSAGLRALLQLRQTLDDKGSVTIVNANELIKEVFEITGFIDALDFE